MTGYNDITEIYPQQPVTYSDGYYPSSADVNDCARSIASELLADVGRLCARGSAYASRFVARAEIVRALGGD